MTIGEIIERQRQADRLRVEAKNLDKRAERDNEEHLRRRADECRRQAREQEQE